MRVRLLASLLFAALLGLAPPAKAVDMNPGDSCAGFPAGAYRPTGGQENPDGAFVVCDGSIWQPILRYSSAGNAVMFSSTGLPAAPVHVGGEAIIGNQGLACGAAEEGALRYTSSSDTWEYCDGAGWLDLARGSGALTLGDLSDTTISSPAADEVLTYNGTSWVNGVLSASSVNAAGSDRQIQFNSGGSIGADANFVFDDAGNLGIGTTSPAVPLDVAGIMRAVDDAAGCTATERGALRFNSAGGALELCDGASWGSVGSGGTGLWSDSGSGYIEYDSAFGGVRIGDVSGEPAPNVIGVTNLNDLGDTTISGPANGQVLTYNNSTGEWENQAPAAETDPQVGAVTNGQWCVGDGSAVQCDQSEPVLTEADPQVGTLTNGKWCTTDGSAVNCTSDPPEGDNLGDHTATQNILLNGNWLSGDGGNEGIFVDAAGRVGIGTSSPSSTFHVDDASAQIQISGPSTVWDSGKTDSSVPFTPQILLTGNNGIDTYNDASRLGGALIHSGALVAYWHGGDSTTDTKFIRITTPGDNRSNYSLDFHTNGSGTSGAEWYTEPSTHVVHAWNTPLSIGSTSGPVEFHIGTGTAPRMYIGSGGNVGIGTTAPDTKLDVEGTVEIADGGETCGAAIEGALRYKNGTLWFCDGTDWLQTRPVTNYDAANLGYDSTRDEQPANGVADCGEFDSGTANSCSSEEYTIPEDGIYMMTGTYRCDSPTDQPRYANQKYYVNGTRVELYINHELLCPNGSTTDSNLFPFTAPPVIRQLNAGDVVRFEASGWSVNKYYRASITVQRMF